MKSPRENMERERESESGRGRGSSDVQIAQEPVRMWGGSRAQRGEAVQPSVTGRGQREENRHRRGSDLTGRGEGSLRGTGGSVSGKPSEMKGQSVELSPRPSS